MGHLELPVVALCFYAFIIFELPKRVKVTYDLKQAFAIWNLILSIFRTLGAFRVAPTLFNTLLKHGFFYTVCTNPEEWYATGPCGLWLGLFIYSKFPELLDTVFLVLRKKPVIFLHWFHHVTVLLYCWHSYHHTVGPGLWFCTMNYLVHSIMYFYYFMMNIGYYRIMRPIAPFITTIQIMQMVVGMVVLITAAYAHQTMGEDGCHTDASNYKLGLLMYF